MSASARAPRGWRCVMMNAPARNLRPPASKSSSAASIVDVRVLEAERHEVVVGGVLDDEHRPGPVDAAGRPDVGGHRGHLLIQHALVARPA